MGSRRLPGKVLRELDGKPLLAYLLERLERCPSLSEVAVATSGAEADDAVDGFCRSAGVFCHRGPEDDVAARMLEGARSFRLDAFVRVSGDSPLLDGALVERGVALLLESGCEVATNVFPRTFPPGQSVEVVRTDAFERACAAMQDSGDREHVTAYLYRRPEEFATCNFVATRDYGGLHLAVDTEDDLARIAALVGRMERPHWDYALDDLAELWTP